MPPGGHSSITVSDGVFEQPGVVMAEQDCDSPAEAIETTATIAIERDGAQLARILADRPAT